MHSSSSSVYKNYICSSVIFFFYRTIVLVDSVPAGHTIQGPVYLPTGGSISGGSETGILRGKVSQGKHHAKKTQ
jgi:hypothetical protein